MEEKRVTIKEISKALGVSPTTVTKALTGKSQVSDKKRALIIATAQDMGYKPNKFARALVRGELKLGIVIPKEPYEFLGYLYSGIEHALAEFADYKVKGVFRLYPDNNATLETIEALHAITEEDIDGLIFAPGFGSAAYTDILRDITETRHIPVVLFGQEMTAIRSAAIIQTDADVMGRIAAQLLGLCLPRGSEVALITTSHGYRSHQCIINGFNQENEQHDWFTIKAVAENYDKPELSFARAKELIEAYPGLKGIYVTSYNFVPVCRCLTESGRGDIAVIGHDLYPEMVPCLLEGPLTASLYQNPFLQGQTAVRVLYEAITEKKQPGEIIIKPELVMRTNLKSYQGDY